MQSIGKLVRKSIAVALVEGPPETLAAPMLAGVTTPKARRTESGGAPRDVLAPAELLRRQPFFGGSTPHVDTEGFCSHHWFQISTLL